MPDKSLRSWRGWATAFVLHLAFLVLAAHWVIRLRQPAGAEVDPPVEPTATADAQPAMPASELKDLVTQGIDDVSRLPIEGREKLLTNQLKRLQQLDPVDMQKIAGFVSERLEVKDTEKQLVPLEELDIANAVPIDMVETVDEAQGGRGVWVTMEESGGKQARYWLNWDAMSDEEHRALRTFTLMQENPLLQELRPIVTHLLRAGQQQEVRDK